jgi:predicted ATPase/class 3 adenylate cyclase
MVPDGVRVFLFTDIEGSTRRWERGDIAMPEALAQHDTILAGAITGAGGQVFKHLGDGMAATFPSVAGAAQAAVSAQVALLAAEWPPDADLRVRMGIHAGHATERDNDYFGATVNRAARLMSAGHGGQILLSGAAKALLDLPDDAWVITVMGSHYLRDLAEPIDVFQLHTAGIPGSFPELHSLDTFPTNLQRYLPTFLGREDLVSALRSELRDRRLVTIVGTAGMGKTRLAQQVGAESLPDHPAGVWFVDLSSASTVDEVVAAVAAAADFKLRSSENSLDALANEIATRNLVLILDNCEQAVRQVAEVVASLLDAAPGGNFLVTSRQALDVPGEAVHRIEGLAVARAAELFCARASTARGDSDLAPDDPTVLALCERLDGAPLAIELAAARARALTPSEILDRLDQRFRLLSGGGRRGERHQTLQVAIDWSYNLLSEQEQLLLDRLGVFAGGCELEAIEVVCATDAIDSWEMLDLIEQLVDKSLVVVQSQGSKSRYRLLEMVADYALAHLETRGETTVLRDQHAQYFASRAVKFDERVRGADLEAAARDVRADYDNLRRALDWMGSRGWHTEQAHTVLNLKMYYTMHNHAEGLRRYDDIIAIGSKLEPKELIELLVGASHVCVQAGAIRRGETYLDQARSLSEKIGVDWPNTLVFSLATLAEMDGRPEDAMRHCRALLASAEAQSDHFLDLLARARMGGSIWRTDPDEAEAFCDETARRAREAGVDLLVAAASLTTGITHMMVTGRIAAAEQEFRRTLDIAGSAVPSASLPALVGLGMLRLDAEPLGALELALEALVIESDGIDEPVSRACCYDVAAAACVELGQTEDGAALARAADHLRETCGFGGYAWAWRARDRAHEALARSAGSDADRDDVLTAAGALEVVRRCIERAEQAA